MTLYPFVEAIKGLFMICYWICMGIYYLCKGLYWPFLRLQQYFDRRDADAAARKAAYDASPFWPEGYPSNLPSQPQSIADGTWPPL
jgi:hypothetical protein